MTGPVEDVCDLLSEKKIDIVFSIHSQSPRSLLPFTATLLSITAIRYLVPTMLYQITANVAKYRCGNWIQQLSITLTAFPITTIW